MIYNLFLLLMGGWCILSISPCQPLHAVGYPFDCPNIVCLISFPNINQTLKQNYPIFKKSKRKRTRSLSECIPIYQSSLQCDVCIPSHLVTMSVTKGRTSPPWKKSPLLKNVFSPSEKYHGRIVCITTVFVHAIDVKFGPPSENYSPASGVQSWLRVCWWLLFPCDFCQLCHPAQSFHSHIFQV